MNSNKINYRISDAVEEAFSDIKEAFKANGLVKIVFHLHDDVESPRATFNNGDGDSEWCVVDEVILNRDYITVIGIDSNGRYWSGYIDKYYGDYFDVGQSIGGIYEGIANVINAGVFFDVERE